MNSSDLHNIKGVKCVHVDILSVKKNRLIACLFSEADLLCCSETWLSSNYAYDDCLVNIQGMGTFRNDRCNASDTNLYIIIIISPILLK